MLMLTFHGSRSLELILSHCFGFGCFGFVVFEFRF